ncbi:MAG: HEAT repeat domain-containing protein [Planctomycetota bacterium]|jgi:hypothetical protein
MSQRLIQALSIIALATAALAAPATTLASPEGPPYFDPARGIEKQQNAAKDAKAEVRSKARKEPNVAFEGLASVSAYVRDAVFKELRSNFNADDLLQLGELGLRHPDPFVAAQIAEVLGHKKVKGAREALEKALKSNSEYVLSEVCWALGEIGDPASVKALDKAAGKYQKKSFRVAGEAYQALMKCDPENTETYLKRGLKGKLAGVRIACLAGAVTTNPAAALKAAVEQIDTKQQKRWGPRVLFQICDLLRDVDKRKPHADIYKQAFDKLIPLMEDKDGREHHEIAKTLRAVSGQDIADDFEAWSSWWGVARDTFEPVDRDPDANYDDAQGGGTVVRYFGIPIYSKRLTFILDLSGGMDRPVGGKGTDTPRRLNVAKDELKKTLGSLDKDVLANVIFFASAYYACAPQLLPVRKALRKINAYIDEQQIPTKPHTNRGNLFDPIVVAMEQEDVDTIYLVTEGNPTEGRFIDLDRFVRHMMRTQKFTKTEVNSLFIGSAKSAVKYLEGVSQPTGGRFHDVSNAGR